MKSMGFSLLELLIVITIGAILAAVGIGSWKDMKYRNELSATTHELIRFLNEVKKDANIYNNNHTIFLFINSDSTWCLAVANDGKPNDCQTQFKFIPKVKNISVVGITIKSKLIFYGRRNMGQAGIIRLKNEIGDSRIIISAQGQVRYCSYNTYLSGFNPC